MGSEQIPQNEIKTSFDTLLEDRKAEGWHYIECAGLTRTKLDENARFVEVPHETEEDIKKRWLGEASKKDPSGEYEVELVPDYSSDKLDGLKKIMSAEEYEEALKNLNDGDKKYFVFLRKKDN